MGTAFVRQRMPNIFLCDGLGLMSGRTGILFVLKLCHCYCYYYIYYLQSHHYDQSHDYHTIKIPILQIVLLPLLRTTSEVSPLLSNLQILQ